MILFKFQHIWAQNSKLQHDTDKNWRPFNKVYDTSDMVKKTDYHAKFTKIGNEIPDATVLLTKNNFNTKVTGTEY